jgi:hypothetical protein
LYEQIRQFSQASRSLRAGSRVRYITLLCKVEPGLLRILANYPKLSPYYYTVIVLPAHINSATHKKEEKGQSIKSRVGFCRSCLSFLKHLF